jgi:hypothetical protein
MKSGRPIRGLQTRLKNGSFTGGTLGRTEQKSTPKKKNSPEEQSLEKDEFWPCTGICSTKITPGKHGSPPDRPAHGGSLVLRQSRPSNKYRIAHGNRKQIRRENQHSKQAATINLAGRKLEERQDDWYHHQTLRPKRTGRKSLKAAPAQQRRLDRSCMH